MIHKYLFWKDCTEVLGLIALIISFVSNRFTSFIMFDVLFLIILMIVIFSFVNMIKLALKDKN